MGRVAVRTQTVGFFLPPSVTLGDVNGPWGCFLAHLSHSAFCLEYYLSLRTLTPMLLEKKCRWEAVVPAYAICWELMVSLFGNSGHLCENMVAFDFYLSLLFMLVMSQADCSRDDCTVQSGGCRA